MKAVSMLMFAILFTLTSCGGSSGGGGNSEARKPFDNFGDLIATLESAHVMCGESGGNCPDNVAMLASWEQEGDKFYFGVCSGTLINEDTLVTNRHCIPEGVNFNGADCSDQLRILFPKTKDVFEKEVLSCQRVVQIFQKSVTQPDLAVIKVERSKFARTPVKIRKGGFIHGDLAYAYTMNPEKEDIHFGTIKRKNCRLSTHNLYYARKDPSYGETLLYRSDCKVISGNSGSGLFNQQGEMIGAIFATIVEESVEQEFRKQGLNFKPLKKAGVAVNIGCLSSFTSTGSKACELGYYPTRTHIEDYLNSLVKDASLLGTTESNIRYQINSDLSVTLSDGARSQGTMGLPWLKARLIDFFSKSEKARIIKRKEEM